MAFDVLILIVAAAACIMGFMKGFLGQAGQVAGLVAGVICSRLFGAMIAGWFAASGAEPSAFDSACGFTIAFFIAYLAVVLAVRAVRSVVRALHLGLVDRLGGAVFKLLLWMMMLSLAVNLYAVATNDTELLEGDSARPWRTAVVRLAPVTLGYLGSEVLNNMLPGGVFNTDSQPSDN